MLLKLANGSSRLKSSLVSSHFQEAPNETSAPALGAACWDDHKYRRRRRTKETTNFRPSKEAFVAYHYNVSPAYLTAAGIPLLAGRDVSFSDTTKTPAVAIVNQEFARRLFHSERALGRYFKNSSGLSIQIVGIVADGKYISLSEDPTPFALSPISQEADAKTTLIVRTRRDAPEMAATIRKVVRNLDPAVPIEASSAWKNQLGMSLFPAQVATVALGLFGAFGLLLSITGTFGLASYTISKRLRELSIRVALGPQAKQILSAALGRMLILLASGSVAGMLLGVAASRVLSAIVYQAFAQDPFVLVALYLRHCSRDCCPLPIRCDGRCTPIRQTCSANKDPDYPRSSDFPPLSLAEQMARFRDGLRLSLFRGSCGKSSQTCARGDVVRLTDKFVAYSIAG
ncbi:MAG TPA: ABC transporter permease [Bryobacteraceae bacterium]|nr:ABC transporter permease [Bryobacteraceae bacterium]